MTYAVAMKYADWLTKEQAAQKLGVSERTVMRLAGDKKIQQKLRPRSGGSPLAVFNPEDVERIASERSAVEGEPFVMPSEAEVQIVQNPSGPPMVAQMGGAIASAIVDQFSRVRPALSLADKPRLTLREAVELGYRADDLVTRVKAGTLENVGTPHRYRFRRRDLDAL